MPDRRRRNCMECGRRDTDAGPISWNGHCLECADRLQRENIASIAAKEGYPYRRQVVGMERYAQRVLAQLRQAV